MRLESILNSSKDRLASESELDIAINMYNSLSKERGMPTSIAFKIDNCFYKYKDKPMSLIFKCYATLQDDTTGILCQVQGEDKVGLLVIKADLSRQILVAPVFKAIEVLSIDCYDLTDFDDKTCLVNSDKEKGYERTYYDSCDQMNIEADIGDTLLKVYYHNDKVCKGLLIITKDNFIVDSSIIKPVDLKVKCSLLYEAISNWDASEVSEEERQEHLNFLDKVLSHID